MAEILLSLVVGLVLGMIFTALKLPIPAPPVLSGIVGIFGIYLGNHTYHWIIKAFFN